MRLEAIKKVYFIGIGGIGMSAIARYMLKVGKEVYGYDKVQTELTDKLKSEGGVLSFEDITEESFEEMDLVIYTPAIPRNSEILNYFQNSVTPVIKRAEALGMISKDKYTIAIAGSHGKTTVSTMMVQVLKGSGIDCSAFLGGISSNFNSNYIYGESKYLVVEADEYDRSFLHLSPNITIVTSVDSDHLDIYGTKENVELAFQEFVNLTQLNGLSILHQQINSIKFNGGTQYYGVDSEKGGKIEIIESKPNFNKFRIEGMEEEYSLNYNGIYNVENATATILAGKCLGISEDKMKAALEAYKGVKRRFELVYSDANITFIDDYAHHPSEVESVLDSVKQLYKDKELIVLFQPHLYSRTQEHHKGFARYLDIADKVYLMDIYPARELPIEGVTSELIADNLPTKAKVVSRSEITKIVNKINKGVIVTLGAGDIALEVEKIKTVLNEK